MRLQTIKAAQCGAHAGQIHALVAGEDAHVAAASVVFSWEIKIVRSKLATHRLVSHEVTDFKTL